MSNEIKEALTLQEQVKALQQQNVVEGQAEIDEVLKRRGLTLVGVPQFAQSGQGWQIIVQVGITTKAGDA